MKMDRWIALLTVVLWAACSGADDAAPGAGSSAPPSRLFIIGQDLGAIRGYVASDCCVRPDGTTAYVDFYDVLSAEADFGGLGIDGEGAPLEAEADWGAGPVNAFRAADEFGLKYLAVGLSITENEHPGGLDGIVAGEYDAEIRHLALFAERVDATILLRIGYEFDGAWNQGYQDAPRFVLAYRRIADGIRAAGAANVRYVWQGAASTTDAVIDQGRHDDIEDWYPGDDYVDWLALSWFMHPDERPGIQLDFDVPTPAALADEILTLARRVGKPVLIAEAAPQGLDLRDRTTANHSPLWDGPAGEDRSTLTDEAIWNASFQPLFDYMADNADVIDGLAYINVRWDDQPMWGPPYASGYWGDTRVEVNADIAARFTAAVRHWRGR